MDPTPLPDLDRETLLLDFDDKQACRLMFLRFVRARGQLTEYPTDYWRRWEPQRRSLGAEFFCS